MNQLPLKEPGRFALTILARSPRLTAFVLWLAIKCQRRQSQEKSYPDLAELEIG